MMSRPIVLNGWLTVSLLGMVLAGSFAMSTHAIRELGELDRRISVIEGNRFDVTDGSEVWREISALRNEMHARDSQISERLAMFPQEVPPRWFLGRVEKIEVQLEQLSDLVRQHMANDR